MRLLLTIVFIILAFINYRHLNIGFLSLVSIDEYAFHHSLINMFEGVIELDIKKLFSFFLYSYGFIFFLINLIFTFPFFITDNTEMTIYLPRIVSSLFATGSLYLIFEITKTYSSKLSSFLIVILVLTMPGFWRNAMWFHPDWMMTFFILLSLYFFSKDNFHYKKYFWYAIFAFGFAISSKLQAITFYPFLFFYIFYDNLNLRSIDNIKLKITLFLKSVICTVLIFIITNPYILHPLGFEVWLGDFLSNMKSNELTHGSGEIISWYDKLKNAINDFYFVSITFLVLIFLVILKAGKYFIVKEKQITHIISLYVLINLFYLIVLVNKDWQHYYLSILITSSLLFVFNYKITKYVLPLIILINLTLSFDQYKKIFLFNPVTVDHIKMSNSLIKVFKNRVDKKTHILIEPYVPFDFKSLGMNYKNIHNIYGTLSKKHLIKEDWYKTYPSFVPFHEKDFIVLKKNSIYFNTNSYDNRSDYKEYKLANQIIENLNSNGEFGFEKFAENDYFYIWKKKK